MTNTVIINNIKTHEEVMFIFNKLQPEKVSYVSVDKIPSLNSIQVNFKAQSPFERDLVDFKIRSLIKGIMTDLNRTIEKIVINNFTLEVILG